VCQKIDASNFGIQTLHFVDCLHAYHPNLANSLYSPKVGCRASWDQIEFSIAEPTPPLESIRQRKILLSGALSPLFAYIGGHTMHEMLWIRP
jgi:hypothetical protein